MVKSEGKRNKSSHTSDPQDKVSFVSARAVARSQDLAPCRTCGRRFAQDVLLRHDPICRKVFNKKRKPFSSMKQRLQGTEIMTIRNQHPQKKQPEKKSNWRQHHEDFINAIRSAKQVTKALKEGRSLPPPPPPSINPDYIQCSHCSRRFNEAAAERHIKFCEEQAIRRAFGTTRPVGLLREYYRNPENLRVQRLDKSLQEHLDCKRTTEDRVAGQQGCVKVFLRYVIEDLKQLNLPASLPPKVLQLPH